MRQTISGLLAAIAVMAAAPAMACGGDWCSPCGYFSPCAQPQVYVTPLAPIYNYAGCDTGCGWARERLPDPVQQYYYVNQGPTYTGPGNWAPVPTYQESAVSGWNAYRRRPYYYGYDGGRYANAINHRYDGAPNIEGPAIYSYRARPHVRPWRAPGGYRYSARPGVRYGYAARHGYAPRYYGDRDPVLRRYN
jgi:hypothetical protein